MFYDALDPMAPGVALRSSPDFVSSSDLYARRFSGAVGEWLLKVQSDAVARLMAPWPEGSVLDVGGGHAQITPPLLEAGRDVTTLVSTRRACERVMRITDGRARCEIGEVEELARPENSADIVIALRMVAHVADWQRFLASLCRVARKAVIVDFPFAGGANALYPLLFNAKKAIEGDTRAYRRVSRAEMQDAFAANGFAADAHIGQFVVPMVVHRFLKSARVSDAAERALRPLAPHLGNPVIICARKL